MSFEHDDAYEKGLDVESLIFRAESIVERQAKIIELTNATVEESAIQFEYSRKYKKLGHAVDLATGLENEDAKHRRMTMLKNTAIAGAAVIGSAALLFAADKYIIEHWIESWRNMRGY